MNKFSYFLNHPVMKRTYSTISHNIIRQSTHQKFLEFLNDINNSKDNVTHITVVKWNTGYQKGNTLIFKFKFTNDSDTYEGQILMRKIINDEINTTEKN